MGNICWTLIELASVLSLPSATHQLVLWHLLMNEVGGTSQKPRFSQDLNQMLASRLLGILIRQYSKGVCELSQNGKMRFSLAITESRDF